MPAEPSGRRRGPVLPREARDPLPAADPRQRRRVYAASHARQVLACRVLRRQAARASFRAACLGPVARSAGTRTEAEVRVVVHRGAPPRRRTPRAPPRSGASGSTTPERLADRGLVRSSERACSSGWRRGESPRSAGRCRGGTVVDVLAALLGSIGTSLTTPPPRPASRSAPPAAERLHGVEDGARHLLLRPTDALHAAVAGQYGDLVVAASNRCRRRESFTTTASSRLRSSFPERGRARARRARREPDEHLPRRRRSTRNRARRRSLERDVIRPSADFEISTTRRACEVRHRPPSRARPRTRTLAPPPLELGRRLDVDVVDPPSRGATHSRPPPPTSPRPRRLGRERDPIRPTSVCRRSARSRSARACSGSHEHPTPSSARGQAMPAARSRRHVVGLRELPRLLALRRERAGARGTIWAASRSTAMLACVAGWCHILSFMAGATISGAVFASAALVRRLSANPWASFAMVFAEAGTIA